MSKNSMPPSVARRFKFLRIYCQVSAMAVATTGGLVLCGWAFHIEFLKSLYPGGVAIKANSALLLALSGTSLWLLLPDNSRTPVRHFARLLAMLTALLGAATRMEYLFGVNLRIDQLLFVEPAGAPATFFPGGMGPPFSASFMLIGMALLVLGCENKHGRPPLQGLSLWAAPVALGAITNYLYGVTPP